MKASLSIAAILTATTTVALAEPWPQAEPNTQYQPAYPEQTRAEAMQSGFELRVEPLVQGLEHPWALAFLPDGSALITERLGRLKLYKDGVVTDVAGIPEVFSEGQGGLLDVSLHPEFTDNRLVYFCENGFIPMLIGTWRRNEEVDGTVFEDSDNVAGVSFAAYTLSTALAYRFPNRRGFMQLQLNNILGKKTDAAIDRFSLVDVSQESFNVQFLTTFNF